MNSLACLLANVIANEALLNEAPIALISFSGQVVLSAADTNTYNSPIDWESLYYRCGDGIAA